MFSITRLFSPSLRNVLAADPPLLPNLPPQRVWQPADHRGAGGEQAYAHSHKLLPAVSSRQ